MPDRMSNGMPDRFPEDLPGRMSAFYMACFLAGEVQRGTRRAESRRLRSGEAHSAQTLAV